MAKKEKVIRVLEARRVPKLVRRDESRLPEKLKKR
jgi:hypothetical protein